MGALLSDSLFVPALMLAAIGFLTPRIVAWFLPEGVKPLLLNAVLSVVIVFLLSTGLFVVLYLSQGVSIADVFALGWVENTLFFGRLGLIGTIIWGPVMLLSLAALPRRWVKETW